MTKEKKTTALAKVAPARESAEEVAPPDLPGIGNVEKSLLNTAVGEINRLYAAKSVETACAVGEYILKTFFKGDMDNFNEWGNKHETFGELLSMAQGEDSPLHISSSGLWYSVRILEQVKALPQEIAMALPGTHHRMLVPVKDEKKKLQLAKMAVSKGLTSRAFQEEVRAVREGEMREGNSPGRPPLPVWAKALKKSVKAIKDLTVQGVTKDSFGNYSADDANELLSEVNDAIDKMKKLQEKIRTHVEKMAE
ncbi:MAG: hypothetical protein PHU25_01205 [Deltaproteobacteria bacterium]|nr:hypothetical protein [Deltaproteobacteria bacterium]